MSGRKPRSSMRSASSRTRTDTCDRSRCFCLTRSSRRPGVPTTASTPSRRASICGSYARPPYTDSTRVPSLPCGDVQVVGDLDGQLTGRHDDERERLLAAVLDALEQRDAECERLARAGTRLADDVVPAEPDGHRERLDRERFDDALALEGCCDFGNDSQIMKCRQGLQPPECGVRSAPHVHQVGDAAGHLAVANSCAARGRAQSCTCRSSHTVAHSRGRDQPSNSS